LCCIACMFAAVGAAVKLRPVWLLAALLDATPGLHMARVVFNMQPGGCI